VVQIIHTFIDLIENANFCGYIPAECKEKQFCVENTLDALQQFAAYYRSLFEFPVII
jgi:alanine racemase